MAGAASMILHAQVPLHRLVLSLSEALDCVDSVLVDHQHRVAYVSLCVGKTLNLPNDRLVNLFHAAALHDLGLIRAEDRAKRQAGRLDEIAWHAEAGYRLLHDNPLFAQAAELVAHHHRAWDGDDGAEVPEDAYILGLADAVALRIDPHRPILLQAEEISRGVAADAPAQFPTEVVDAFRTASRPRAFWLDCASDRIYGILLDRVDWPLLSVDEVSIEPIAQTFARIVDAVSPWTATHTAGVASLAVALAERLCFSPREKQLMRAAAYFHDLGKLTVPAAILDKPGRLSTEERQIIEGHTYHTFHILNTIGGLPQICEWAAFHHERLDGTGYPFCHEGRQLTLGARIMAVADVATALSEDRPYRRGMTAEETHSILDKQVRSGALDADVVAALRRDFAEVDAQRRSEQAAYAERQRELLELTRIGSAAVREPAAVGASGGGP
jgi:putative nucleotidyltransferase with HDIG domain